MSAIFLRELKSYFTGFTGYLYAAFVLLFAGIYMMVINLNQGYPQFEYTLESMAFIFLIAVPILTMRVFAEEMRQKTDQLLYSLPVKLSSVVTAKYLAMLLVTLVPVLVMSAYPILLNRFGIVAFKRAYSSLFMFFLLGGALTGIGMFISSLTENQVISAVITLVVMLLSYFMSGLAGYVSSAASASLIAIGVVVVLVCVLLFFYTKSLPLALALALICLGSLSVAYAVNADAFSGLFPRAMSALSLFDRFYDSIGGVFDLTSAVYYVTIAFVFWFLTTQVLEKRRWS